MKWKQSEGKKLIAIYGNVQQHAAPERNTGALECGLRDLVSRYLCFPAVVFAPAREVTLGQRRLVALAVEIIHQVRETS